MWVFGYGSLVWSPGFSYEASRIGYIRGYVRRFWQGNDFHRGSPKKVGRVATLVEDKEGLTWGRAFLLGKEAESSMSYLDSREAQLGGYSTTIVTFYPRDPKESPIPVLLYVALPESRLYMGPAPLCEVATEIAEARGNCGYNAEYLFRLADFMREQVPDFWDEHLYHLEHLVRARLKERNVSIEEVLGNREQDFDVSRIAAMDLNNNDDEEQQERQRSPRRSPDFASQIPSRKLKCVDL